MKTHDRKKALGLANEYKQWRNKVFSMVRKAKSACCDNIIDSSNKKPGNVWKLFDELSNKSQSKKSQTTIKLEKDDSNENNIADEFNEYFVNIPTKIKENIHHDNSQSRHDHLENFCKSKFDTDDESFDIPPVSKAFVEDQLLKIDIKKSAGLDNIGPRVLLAAAQIISSPLTWIFNLCISTGYFPKIWKKARVTP